MMDVTAFSGSSTSVLGALFVPACFVSLFFFSSARSCSQTAWSVPIRSPGFLFFVQLDIGAIARRVPTCTRRASFSSSSSILCSIA